MGESRFLSENSAWINTLPEGWDYYVLPDLITDVVDNRGRSAPTANSGIPLIATNCIKNDGLFPVYEKVRYVSQATYDNWFRGHPQPEDIIIVNKGTPGLTCLVPDPVDFCIAQDMIAIRANQNLVTPKYLFAALRSPYFLQQVEAFNVGTTIPHLKKTDFPKLVIPVPPFAEQELIGEFYYSLSLKIELNRRMNATLEAMARAIFKSWFVDFDPVHAKARGEQPAGMDAEMAALFPDSFEDSELGLIPRGWGVGDVYDIADVIYGAPFSSALFNSSGMGLPLIRIRDLRSHEPAVFTNEDHPKATIVEPGDVLVGMDGEFRVHFWRGQRAYLNQRVCMFNPKPHIPKAFLAESIRGPLAFYENTKTGTTVIHLGKRDIDKFSLILPPLEVLAAFGIITNPILKLMVSSSQESYTFAQLRDSLLPKLISGEMRVIF